MTKWGRKRPRKIIFLIGMYTIGYGLYDMFYAGVVHHMRDKVNLRQRYGAGTWAVVSGATNDVGKEFSQ